MGKSKDLKSVVVIVVLYSTNNLFLLTKLTLKCYFNVPLYW